MDLLIYYVDDPADWPGRCIYVNNKLYTLGRPSRPYRENFWIDLINDYVTANSISKVSYIKIIKVCIDFWNYKLKVLENFSDYPKESFCDQEYDYIIIDGTLEQIMEEFYSHPENRK